MKALEILDAERQRILLELNNEAIDLAGVNKLCADLQLVDGQIRLINNGVKVRQVKKKD